MAEQNNDLQDYDSANAVHYLNVDETGGAPTNEPRAVLNVPAEPDYSLQRFLHPEHHPEDAVLRPPLAFRQPMSVQDSVQRMSALLADIARGLPAE